jgi:hypothetical protein
MRLLQDGDADRGDGEERDSRVASESCTWRSHGRDRLDRTARCHATEFAPSSSLARDRKDVRDRGIRTDRG